MSDIPDYVRNNLPSPGLMIVMFLSSLCSTTLSTTRFRKVMLSYLIMVVSRQTLMQRGSVMLMKLLMKKNLLGNGSANQTTNTAPFGDTWTVKVTNKCALVLLVVEFS